MLYESCVILNAQLSEEDRTAQIEKLTEALTSNGAEVTNVALWGRRILANPINKLSDGFYVIIHFRPENPAVALKALDKSYRFEDNVLRVMTIKVPEMKKGVAITPMVPAPGQLADFTMKLRPQAPRRRPGGDMRRGGGDPRRSYDGPPRDSAPSSEGSGSAKPAPAADEAKSAGTAEEAKPATDEAKPAAATAVAPAPSPAATPEAAPAATPEAESSSES